MDALDHGRISILRNEEVQNHPPLSADMPVVITPAVINIPEIQDMAFI